MNGKLIGDNADYIARFIFDEEWNGKIKTARFIMKGIHSDVILEDDQCTIPVEILKKGFLQVGVYSDKMTTTCCEVFVSPSIKEAYGSPAEPSNDVYAQIIQMIQGIEDGSVSEEEIETVVSAYISEHIDDFRGSDGVSPSVSVESITNGNRITITDANGSHPFDVMNGTDGNVFPSDIADAVEDYLAENPIDTANKLQFIESNDFKLTNSTNSIIAHFDNMNRIMYMGNYAYIDKYDVSNDSPTLVKMISPTQTGLTSTAVQNGRAMTLMARNCVILGDYIYYGMRNASGQNMDTSENACNGGILIINKSDFSVAGQIPLPHLVTWLTSYVKDGMNYIFANLRTEGFKLYEVTTNPLVPTLVFDGSLPHDAVATHEHQTGNIIQLPSGKTLYVAMGFANAIYFYDIDDLTNITLLKKVTIGASPTRDVQIGHTFSAYIDYPFVYCTAAPNTTLTYKTAGLFRLDISDIENGNVGVQMHLVDESLCSTISTGDMQPCYIERWGDFLLLPANEKGIYVYRLINNGDVEFCGVWSIESTRLKSEGYDIKPCRIFTCKSDYLGRLFVPEADIVNQSDVSVMSNSREPYRRCHIYKQIKTIK